MHKSIDTNKAYIVKCTYDISKAKKYTYLEIVLMKLSCTYN